LEKEGFMGVNSRYKDSVFFLLFSDPDTLRELYSAIEGVYLDPDIPIEINTLQDAVFKGKINDISFSIGGKLVVLIEHQSTINPNMPVRLLMYIARVYEKLLEKRNIYSSKRIPFPCPEFIVLYNGTAPCPDRQTLRLSDSFEDTASLGVPAGSPVLELVVKVYNINQGHNEAIVKKSETLAGYSVFIAKIREYRQSMTLEDAMKAAVEYCIKHDILRIFFEENASEVANMLLNEWNWDDYVAVQREEALEEGLEKGREETARNALAEGLPIEIIRKITGLDTETIQGLSG
jgi:hypothetical protein